MSALIVRRLRPTVSFRDFKIWFVCGLVAALAIVLVVVGSIGLQTSYWSNDHTQPQCSQCVSANPSSCFDWSPRSASAFSRLEQGIPPGASEFTLYFFVQFDFFEGDVFFSASGHPANVTVNFNPSSLHVPSGSAFTETPIVMTISTDPSFSGSFNLTITMDSPNGQAYESLCEFRNISYTVPVTVRTPPTIIVLITPTSQTVRQGGSVIYTFNISGTPQPVSASEVTMCSASVCVESLIDFVFSPESGIPPFTSTLTFQVPESVEPDTYTLTIVWEGGGVSREVVATLIVEEAVKETFDFSISVTPSENTVIRGVSASYLVTISLVQGRAEPVTLLAPKSDEQLAFTFDPASGTPPFNSTLTVSTSNATKLGRWWFVIGAEGGGVYHETDRIYLIVEEGCVFELSVFPTGEQEVTEGDSVSWSVKITWVSGGPAPVNLEVVEITGTPLDYQITPSWLGAPTRGLARQESAGLTIYVDRLPNIVGHQYPVGRYEITIKVTAECATQYETVFLKVLPCSSSWVAALPAERVGDQRLSLGPIPEDADASWKPAKSQTIFKADDKPSILSWIRFESIFPSEKEFNVPDHIVTWEWINPDGDLVRVGTQFIPTTPKRCQFWLNYNVFDELPSPEFADSPGKWVVKVYFDDTLKLIQNFEVKPVSRVPSFITLETTPSTFSVGGTTIIDGSLSPPHEASIVIEFRAVGEAAWSTLSTITTKADGSFSYSWTPEKAGRYEVRASWQGDADHQAAVSPTRTVTVEEKRCIIATAAYGSELNPHVQFLREFRENVVLATFAGEEFLNIFNAWYYSFSPNVAAFISTHEPVKAVVQSMLYPLIGILHLGVISDTALSFNGELGIIVTGVIVSALIGAVYFTPLTIIPLYAVKKWKRLPKLCRLKILLLPWITSILMTFLGEATLTPTLMMVGTGVLVLSTITLAAGALALKVAHKIP